LKAFWPGLVTGVVCGAALGLLLGPRLGAGAQESAKASDAQKERDEAILRRLVKIENMLEEMSVAGAGDAEESAGDAGGRDASVAERVSAELAKALKAALDEEQLAGAFEKAAERLDARRRKQRGERLRRTWEQRRKGTLNRLERLLAEWRMGQQQQENVAALVRRVLELREKAEVDSAGADEKRRKKIQAETRRRLAQVERDLLRALDGDEKRYWRLRATCGF